MSEEELNQELSTDELKDVSGGFATKEEIPDVSGVKGNPQWRELCDVGTSVKGNNLTDKAKWANRLTLQEHNR